MCLGLISAEERRDWLGQECSGDGHTAGNIFPAQVVCSTAGTVSERSWAVVGNGAVHLPSTGRMFPPTNT